MNMELNLTDMKMLGNDGCNDIGAEISQVTKDMIQFQGIYGTKKMCPFMDLPNLYRKNLANVRFYERDGLMLYLKSENKETIVKLKKVD